MNHPQLDEVVKSLKAFAATLPLDKYVNIETGSFTFASGATLEEAYPECHQYLTNVLAMLGIDPNAVGYTYRVVNKLNKEGKVVQHVNLPNVRLVQGVPCLCWGEVQRPLNELPIRARGLMVPPAKEGWRPGYCIEFIVPKKLQKAIGASVSFKLATDSEKEVTLAFIEEALDRHYLTEAEANEKYGDEDPITFGSFMRETGKGSSNGGNWAKSTASLFGTTEEVQYRLERAESQGIDEADVFEPITVKVISELSPGTIGTYPTIEFYAETAEGEAVKLWMFANGIGERVHEGCQFDVVFNGLTEGKDGRVFVKTKHKNIVSATQLKHGVGCLKGLTFDTATAV